MEEFWDTSKRFCSTLFDVLEEKGVRDVVCSPGSRNAPLLIAAASRKGLKKHVVVDERSAAFMALGISSVSRRPVALVCTSGTALLNYAPAVAEAFYQNMPLIVISADRPQQWIDQDDSQTIRQFEALSNFVKKSYELPAWGDDDPELQWYANRIANDAMIEAMSGRPGPVHVNVRLGEPLGKKVLRDIKPQRVIDLISADGIVNKETEKRLALELMGKRVMLVAGFMPPNARLQQAVSEFCSLPNVVAMTETLSNLHLRGDSHSVDSVLTAYTQERLDSEAPDIVVSLGGALVSRKLKEYLRRNKDRVEHWSLGWSRTTTDCFMSLTKRIEAHPATILRHLASAIRSQMKKGASIPYGDYSEIWRRLRHEASVAKDAYVASATWSELMAFSMIMEELPQGSNLFLSNGTPVRYGQILGQRMPHAVYCNRGVSGIDGSGSTAVGGAMAYGGMTVFVSGDLSMAYDIGALTLPHVPERMKIIVIDNQGGGIFRFIPTTSGLEEREEYFCAAQPLPLRNLAEGYGWEYMEASSPDEMRDALRSLFSTKCKGLLRVVCDGELSAGILRGYMSVRVTQ